MAHRKVILDNIHDLSELTNCSLRFLTMCQQERVLNISELEELTGMIGKRYDQNSTFYHTLRTKDASDVEKVIEIMRRDDVRQNSDVINILSSFRTVEVPETLGAAMQRLNLTQTDSSISRKQIGSSDYHWIVTYLCDDTEIAQSLERFYLMLGLPHDAHLIDLKRRSQNDSYLFLIGCISKFASSKSKEANYYNLYQLIKDSFQMTADKIVNDRRAK